MNIKLLACREMLSLIFNFTLMLILRIILARKEGEEREPISTAGPADGTSGRNVMH